ncbi:hydroxycarboxylic acid receptor 2-like [Limanda limanda]|uniref:hydroxycarboxylic acid receptor 2-like n=1 Tax=Limanda limanda TaxID=27771 RepID=UPI0029C75BC4|nr:hydroxycarboxylic acid receptor 2-like [Limanda limanda]
MFNSTWSPTSNFSVNSTTPGPPAGPPPWYQYHMCSVAPYGYVFYFVVKILNLFVGTPCNILVIWQIISKKSDASTSDTFIFNLAVLDAFFCLMTPVDMINRLLLGDSNFWYFLRFTYGVKDIAPLFLVCICLDRYIAVVHPVLFTSIRDNKMRIGISVVVWGFTLAYGVAKSLLDVVKASGIFSGVILFAFAVMVFCNISIIWVLRRSVAGKEVMHPVKKRAFKTVLNILVIIVVNYLPPVALMPFVAYYTLVQYRCQISTSVFALMDLSSSLEPLLYITKMELKEIKCCGRSLSEKPEEVRV